MGNRIFVAAVIILWAGSMSWLVVDKVLPSYYGGPPPATRGFEQGIPVGWDVEWGGRPVGFACSIRKPGAAGTSEIRNRVVMHDLPLAELAPAWMRTVVGNIGDLRFDAATRLEFDSLGNFASFNSHIKINDIPDVLVMSGRMDGAFLVLNIRSGELKYPANIPIENNSALSEALFPDANLPYMYVGRKWYEDLYHPFRSPSEPVETIEVEVVSEETVNHLDEIVRVFRVEYRGEASPGIPEEARLQAIAWVEPQSGDVIRQDVIVGRSRLKFTRVDQKKAEGYAEQLMEQSRYRSRREHDAPNEPIHRGFVGEGRREAWRYPLKPPTVEELRAARPKYD
ncbi:MAG: hypothetical protein KF847_11800 [Pirellulales bacterium]|nr:hypothetical protein [Pirellulales bacterium]